MYGVGNLKIVFFPKRTKHDILFWLNQGLIYIMYFHILHIYIFFKIRVCSSLSFSKKVFQIGHNEPINL